MGSKPKAKNQKKEKRGLHYHPMIEPIVTAISDFQAKHNGLVEQTTALAMATQAALAVLMDKGLVTDDELREKAQQLEANRTGDTHESTATVPDSEPGDRADSDVSDDSVDHGTPEDSGS